jgi:NTP pyrophosphatase (non-canonical NTP hydrolase)
MPSACSLTQYQNIATLYQRMADAVRAGHTQEAIELAQAWEETAEQIGIGGYEASFEDELRERKARFIRQSIEHDAAIRRALDESTHRIDELMRAREQPQGLR